MTEPLNINIRKFQRPIGATKSIATFESGSGVTVQIWDGNSIQYQQALTHEEYEKFREKVPEYELPNYPTPNKENPVGGTNTNGNTLGRVVGETRPATVPATLANPPIESQTEAEGITGEQILDGVQIGLDVIGLIPGIGELADIGNAGVSFVRGDHAGAALSLAAAIPFAGWFATAGKIGKRATDLSGASKPAKKSSQDTPSKPNEQKDSAQPESTKDKTGGHVEDNGKDCRLRRHAEGCHSGKTPHHVVPDRVFRMPGEGGVRLPNGVSYRDGFCICVDGASPRKKGPRPNEHGMIHALYDAEEQAIGALSDPHGTAPLWKLEAAGVAAASAITGCNPIIMAAQLRAHHQSKGLSPSVIYRADPTGAHIKNIAPELLGKTTTPKGSGGL